MQYKAKLRSLGLDHQVQKHKHAKKGMRFPATVQTYAKPAKGKKITIQYGNALLSRLRGINSLYGFWIVRRIGGVIFNKRNTKWAQTWTKLFGVQARIPYPLDPGEFAVGENILCDGNTVTVVAERKGFLQILPQIVRLYEVEIGTGKLFAGGLYWYIYPDPAIGEIWIEKDRVVR